MIRLNDREFCGIVEYIRDNYGINLEKKQVLIECRMARELEKRGLTSFAQYMEQMRKDRTGEMAGEMVNRLTTNYTYFMREPAHFSILHYKILPELFENRKIPAHSSGVHKILNFRENDYEAEVSDTMSEKFIKYKYIIAAGGKENGRNRSYRYFN